MEEKTARMIYYMFFKKKKKSFLSSPESFILLNSLEDLLTYFHSDLFHQHLSYQAGNDFTFLFHRNLEQVGGSIPNRNTNIFELTQFSTFLYHQMKSLHFCNKRHQAVRQFFKLIIYLHYIFRYNNSLILNEIHCTYICNTFVLELAYSYCFLLQMEHTQSQFLQSQALYLLSTDIEVTHQRCISVSTYT